MLLPFATHQASLTTPLQQGSTAAGFDQASRMRGVATGIQQAGGTNHQQLAMMASVAAASLGDLHSAALSHQQTPEGTPAMGFLSGQGVQHQPLLGMQRSDPPGRIQPASAPFPPGILMPPFALGNPLSQRTSESDSNVSTGFIAEQQGGSSSSTHASSGIGAQQGKNEQQSEHSRLPSTPADTVQAQQGREHYSGTPQPTQPPSRAQSGETPNPAWTTTNAAAGDAVVPLIPGVTEAVLPRATFAEPAIRLLDQGSGSSEAAQRLSPTRSFPPAYLLQHSVSGQGDDQGIASGQKSAEHKESEPLQGKQSGALTSGGLDAVGLTGGPLSAPPSTLLQSDPPHHNQSVDIQQQQHQQSLSMLSPFAALAPPPTQQAVRIPGRQSNPGEQDQASDPSRYSQAFDLLMLQCASHNNKDAQQ